MNNPHFKLDRTFFSPPSNMPLHFMKLPDFPVPKLPGNLPSVHARHPPLQVLQNLLFKTESKSQVIRQVLFPVWNHGLIWGGLFSAWTTNVVIQMSIFQKPETENLRIWTLDVCESFTLIVTELSYWENDSAAMFDCRVLINVAASMIKKTASNAAAGFKFQS